MAKKYSSFSEIDEHLRILRLQREIDKESIKLHLSLIKANLYPTSLLNGATGIFQKLLLTFAIKKLSNFSGLLKSFIRRERIEVLE